jgi:UDP-N-acetylglucosamine 4-epimerase
VATANLLALTSKNAVGEVFNIASGQATTINTLVQILQKTMRKTDLKPTFGAVRTGDIRRSCASIEKATRMLGYKPMLTLKKGLKKLVEWYKDWPM